MSVPLPAPVATRDDILVRSEILGDLSVPCDELLHFAQGLYGFPECRRFILVAAERDGVYWLQSADYSALAFLLVDPFVYFPGYQVDLSRGELARLQAVDSRDVVVLAIVTMPTEPGAPFTANLQGPVVMNMRARTGGQCVLTTEGYGVREPLVLDGAASGERGER